RIRYRVAHRHLEQIGRRLRAETLTLELALGGGLIEVGVDAEDVPVLRERAGEADIDALADHEPGRAVAVRAVARKRRRVRVELGEIAVVYAEEGEPAIEIAVEELGLEPDFLVDADFGRQD